MARVRMDAIDKIGVAVACRECERSCPSGSGYQHIDSARSHHPDIAWPADTTTPSATVTVTVTVTVTHHGHGPRSTATLADSQHPIDQSLSGSVLRMILVSMAHTRSARSCAAKISSIEANWSISTQSKATISSFASPSAIW